MFARVDGKEITGISGTDEKALKIVAKDFEKEIQLQQEDYEKNYGLLFYRHGYDGKAQNQTRDFYREEYGVDVF